MFILIIFPDYRLEFFHLGLNQHPFPFGGLRRNKNLQSCFLPRSLDILKLPSAVSFEFSRYSTSSYSVHVGLTYSIKVWLGIYRPLEGCSSENSLIFSQESQFCFPKKPIFAIKTVILSIFKLVIVELHIIFCWKLKFRFLSRVLWKFLFYVPSIISVPLSRKISQWDCASCFKFEKLLS